MDEQNDIIENELKKKVEKNITLKSWYQGKLMKLERKNQLIDFSIFGPLSSFYYSARVEYGGDYALKPRRVWNDLYNKFSK